MSLSDGTRTLRSKPLTTPAVKVSVKPRCPDRENLGTDRRQATEPYRRGRLARGHLDHCKIGLRVPPDQCRGKLLAIGSQDCDGAAVNGGGDDVVIRQDVAVFIEKFTGSVAGCPASAPDEQRDD